MSRVPKMIVATALLMTPATAMAVNVSSNDGSGEQHVTSWIAPHGANLDGGLKSTTGKSVYYQGAGTVVGGNTGYKRYTSNVTSTSNVRVGGRVTGFSLSKPTGVAVKICKVNTGLPDGCGKSVGMPR